MKILAIAVNSKPRLNWSSKREMSQTQLLSFTPCMSVISGFAPLSRSSSTISLWPPQTARNSGVSPFLSLESMVAPLLTKNSTHASEPDRLGKSVSLLCLYHFYAYHAQWSKVFISVWSQKSMSTLSPQRWSNAIMSSDRPSMAHNEILMPSSKQIWENGSLKSRWEVYRMSQDSEESFRYLVYCKSHQVDNSLPNRKSSHLHHFEEE